MTNYEFAIKHCLPFKIFCEAAGISHNPHDTKSTSRFRKAVEKKMNLMNKATSHQSKAHGFALIGKGKSTVSPVASHSAGADAYAIRDVIPPRKGRVLVESDSFVIHG